jgi:hypothetical protein
MPSRELKLLLSRVPPNTKTFTDNYSDPAHELLPTASSAGLQAQYVGGEYQIALSDQTPSTFQTSGAPDPFMDVAISVDARIVGDPTNQQVAVGCRLLPVGQQRVLVGRNTEHQLGRAPAG